MVFCHFISGGGMLDERHGQERIVRAEPGILEVRGVSIADEVDVFGRSHAVRGHGDDFIRKSAFPDQVSAIFGAEKNLISSSYRLVGVGYEVIQSRLKLIS